MARDDSKIEDADPASLAIVFDLDGTLIDSAPDIHGIANALLREEGLPPITLDEARSFIGHGAPVFVERMRAARGIPDSAQPRLLDAFVSRYDTAVTLTEPYEGVEEALRTLSARHPLGICTNKPHRPCLAVLRHLGLDRYFKTVIGGDSLPQRKPDPTPLLAAFKALGQPRGLYVGDSEVDAETAERAGMPFLLFSGGYRKRPVEDLPHMAVFDGFVELPSLVKDAAAAFEREHRP